MIKSYLKIAFRNLFKNRLISFINIFGLGLSMSVGMMIMIRLQDQLNYDCFHPHPGRMYRITSSYTLKNGTQWNMASTPLPLSSTLAQASNDIESSVNIYPAFNGKGIAAGKEIYLNGAFTDPSFFKVFGFSLAAGNPETVLKMPNTMVITKTASAKFFGSTNPLGKVIRMERGGDFMITGVLNDIPGKSHINYEAYASYSSVPQLEKNKILDDKSADWFAFNSGYTYVLLKKGFKMVDLSRQLNSIATGLNARNKDGIAAFNLQPIEKIRPAPSNLSNDIGSGTSWAKLYFEIGMALIILIAACFNYTNLTISRALKRAKEAGMRKIAGARRYQLFTQYIVESVLVAFLSLEFGWFLLSFIIHYAPFNDDYEFIPSSFNINITLSVWSICFALFTGFIAGVFPAWILSSFRPLQVLKNLPAARISGKLNLQKTLIVFQYSLSLAIIIFLLAFYRQFAFMSKADPGFKKDNVMVIPINGLNEHVVSQKIRGVSGVTAVAAMSSGFRKHFEGMNAPVWLSNKKDAIGLNYYYADENFIPSMEFSFLAGQNFPSSENENYIILNEKAVRALGIRENQNAIGQKLWLNDSTRLEIIGVLKDFNYENAGSSIAPIAFRNKKDAYSYLYVVAGNTGKASLEERIEEIWNKLSPSQHFTFSWLDEQLDRNNSQSATISLLAYLAFIAIAIASLGLLGLVIYNIEVKRKDISIRKVIGAGVTQLVKMLSLDFIKLLFIAGLIAMPVGYITAVLFLQGFASRINFGLWNVLLCFLFLLGIGLFTVISQTYKAANANPVESLRTE